MDDQNKGLNERWGEPRHVSERGYAGDETADRTTTEIRSEIEQTRGEMQETIDAIGDRLRPRNVVSRAAGTVRDATVGRVKQAAADTQDRWSGRSRAWGDGGGNAFTERIRQNPVPAAIAAASLAWLAFSGRRRDHGMSTAIYGSTVNGEPYIRETSISTDVEDIGDSYEDDLESSRGSIRDRAGHAVERAQALTSDAGSRMRRATRTAQSGARRLTHQNTIAAGAIAAAIGVAIGLALPETDRENEMMGEARDSVVGKAKEAARGAAQRVQTAAERVGKAAADTAEGIDDTRM